MDVQGGYAAVGTERGWDERLGLGMPCKSIPAGWGGMALGWVKKKDMVGRLNGGLLAAILAGANRAHVGSAVGYQAVLPRPQPQIP